MAIAAQAAGMVVRGPVINQIGGAKPQALRAYVRATTNVGIALAPPWPAGRRSSTRSARTAG
ncbi:hypothetical protein NKG94_01670 [Micromonospora sp. M12]